MDKPQIIIHAQKSVTFTLFDARWISGTPQFVVLGSHPRGTGALQIFRLSKGEIELVHQAEKSQSLKCGTFGASNLGCKHLATGSFEGKLTIWDLEDTERHVYAVDAHREIINCIDGVGGLGVGEGAPELVTGSRDGCVRVWDPRQKDPVAQMEPAEAESKRDCWSVAFGHAYNAQDRCVAAGYDNGDLKLFDLKSMSVRWEANLGNGICSLEFDRKDIDMNKLVATCLESKFHVFDMRTQHPKEGFANLIEKAHKSTVWGCRHLPQNRDVFMTLGGSGSMNLWKYNYPAQRVKKIEDQSLGVAGSVSQLQAIGMSSQPMSGFDWSVDKTGLAVATSFDQTIRVVITTGLVSL